MIQSLFGWKWGIGKDLYTIIWFQLQEPKMIYLFGIT